MKLNEVNSFDARLTHMIQGVKDRYGFKASVGEIKRLVQMDYDESDITKVTPRDIVEILDASGVE